MLGERTCGEVAVGYDLGGNDLGRFEVRVGGIIEEDIDRLEGIMWN